MGSRLVVVMIGALVFAFPTASEAKGKRKGSIACPKGTIKNITGDPSGFEEFCANRRGVRHGAYRRYYPSGGDVFVKGAYQHGRKVGRWLVFGPDGAMSSSEQHERRRVQKKRRSHKRRKRMARFASR